MHFTSGVEVNPLIPLIIAFVISFFTSQAGVSGAFLLLPFQVSVFGFTSPSVSSTNLVYNIVAIPGGVYEYIREKRMVWALALVIILGTLPGVFIGAIIRIKYLPDPKPFKLFVGCVLLYLGSKLLYEALARKRGALEKKFDARVKELKRSGKKIVAGLPEDAVVKTLKVSLRKIEYEFWGEKFGFSPLSLFTLAFVVGIIGGIYGIGGGAIIAPFCVAVFGLPAYTIAGAALLGTFLTSIVGIIYYTSLGYPPDWMLGAFFGIGGTIGMFLGARFQKFMPEKIIKFILGVLVTVLAIRYIVQYFL
jgi:uncharacterized membrane protein YfcA